jgi:predicted nucleic-acid-binding protein
MIALDTNVLIRLIIFDDPMQSGIADDLIRNNRIFISKGPPLDTNAFFASSRGA